MNSKWTDEQIFIDDNAQKKIFGTCYKIKKSKLKMQGKKSKFFVFALIILLIGVAYFVVNISTNLTSVASEESNSSAIIKSINYYAISIASSSDIGPCQKVAEQCKILGGAGKVYTTNATNYVLVSIYNNKEQANSVLNKLIQSNYTKAQMLTIKASEKDYSTSITQSIYKKSNFSKLLLIFNNAFNMYVSLSNDFDLSTLSHIECKEKILQFYNEYYDIFERTKKSINLQSNQNAILVNNIQQVLNIMQASSDVFSSQDNYSSVLKYSAIQIALNRVNL